MAGEGGVEGKHLLLPWGIPGREPKVRRRKGRRFPGDPGGGQ